MGGVISWLAYIWLVTTEVVEELFYLTIGDFFRRFIATAEFREESPKVERRMLSCQKPTTAVKVTDTI